MNDNFPGSAFHPSVGTNVTAPPSQSTVDRSGDDITGEDAGYEGGGNNGHVAVMGLPHPDPKPLIPAGFETSYDPLSLLDAIYALSGVVLECNRRLSLGEDESIKRRMRGPLKGFSTVDSDGIAEVSLGPVPAGEIWLIDRYIVTSNNGLPTAAFNCYVYDGGPFPDSLIDFTAAGNAGISDNAQPVMLMPQMSLLFRWTGGTEGSSVWARANYRSIEVNAAFAHPRGDTNQ